MAIYQLEWAYVENLCQHKAKKIIKSVEKIFDNMIEADNCDGLANKLIREIFDNNVCVSINNHRENNSVNNALRCRGSCGRIYGFYNTDYEINVYVY